MAYKEGKMAHKGHTQGEMSPVVEDYQKPLSSYSEKQFGTTTEYIERKDAHEHKRAKTLESVAYKGRYN